MMEQYEAYKGTGLEWVEKIPSHWRITKFKYLYKSNMGETILKEDLIEDGKIPVYSATESDDIFGYVNESNVLLSKGDIVIPARGNSIGHIMLVDDTCTCTQTTIYSKKITNIILDRYIFHYLKALRKQMFQFDSTAIPQITVSQVKENLITIPPLPEQRVIAQFLDDKTAQVDQLITRKQQMLALLKEERAALINHAVTKGLDAVVPVRDSGIEWLGEVPKHWAVKRLKHLLIGLEQGWSPSCESREAEVGEWGVLKVGCVNGLRFNASENKALPQELTPMPEYEISAGDFLISRANTKELVGSASIVGEVRSKLMLCDKLFRLFFNYTANPEYVLLIIGSFYGRYQIQTECSGASSSMQNISQEFLKNMVVLLPSEEEQRAIVEYVAEQTARIVEASDAINQEIILLQEYRAALIAEAVTGQIDVRNYEIAPSLTAELVG